MSGPPSKSKRRAGKFVKGLIFVAFAASAIGMLMGGMRLGGGPPATTAKQKRAAERRGEPAPAPGYLGGTEDEVDHGAPPPTEAPDAGPMQ